MLVMLVHCITSYWLVLYPRPPSCPEGTVGSLPGDTSSYISCQWTARDTRASLRTSKKEVEN